MNSYFWFINNYKLQGQASLNVPNHRGDTPLSMLQTQVGAIWIGSKVSERIKEAAATASISRNCFNKITKDKVSHLIFFNENV